MNSEPIPSETEAKTAIKHMESRIEQTNSLLKSCRESLASKGYATGKSFSKLGNRDILERDSGILLPIMPEKVLYDHYTLSILDSYIALSTTIYENRQHPLTPFTQRTLGELGITQAAIMFSPITTDRDKQRYSLLGQLITFLVLFPRPEYVSNYNKLYADEFKLLTEEEARLFTSGANYLLKSVGNTLPRDVYNVFNDFENKLFNKTKPYKDPIFSNTNLFGIKHYSSLLLHANHIALREILIDRDVLRHELRNTYWLLLCNLYISRVVCDSLSSPSLIEEFDAIAELWMAEKDGVTKAAGAYRRQT